MNKILKINLENCFGIGELKHDFKFSTDKNVQLIYAPNGTMKTSLSNVFELLSADKKDEIKDRVFIEKVPVVDIQINNEPIDKNSILVINANNKDTVKSITKFIASNDLKRRYDEIYDELSEEKNRFITILRKQSRSTDCESEMKSAFEDGETIFEYLERIDVLLGSEYQSYDFKYNDVFDKTNKVRVFISDNESLLDDYFQRYNELLTKSNFFRKSDNSFGTLQANSLLESVSDNSFFEAGHTISLSTDEIISSKDDFTALIKNEMDQILKDEKLLKTFAKIDNALSKNPALRSFKNVIEKDQTLLIKLKNYEGFRKHIWLSYISEIKNESNRIVELYKIRKNELKAIISSANAEIEKWKETIELFNSRFYVPFTVGLENQSDIILQSAAPKLTFTYKGSKLEDNNETTLLNLLSRGESRAYFILKFLFEIESRLSDSQELMLIFDDVADSFDYKNKYAIIEYIKDLLENPSVNALILTHNFDFYRTLHSRLSIQERGFMASKCNEGKVKLFAGKYTKDVFNNVFVKKYKIRKNFIGLIPFIRNLFDYLSDEEGKTFLTSCLHIKSTTSEIKVCDIHEYLIRVLRSKSDIVLDFQDKNYLDMVFEESNLILNNISEHSIDLEDKLVLAIACRLKAEIFMISVLQPEKVALIGINQTCELYKLCKKSGVDKEILKLINKVNLITPEHIHVNSFMFEPLVDMSINYLADLYRDISKLHADVQQVA